VATYQNPPELQINPHTLRIASKIYPLRNIARVEAIQFKPNKSRPIWRIVILSLIVFAVLDVVGSSGSGNDVGVIGGAYAVVALVLIIRVLLREPTWMLLLETNGNPFSILTSKRPEPILDLFGHIAEALENPPTTSQVFSISGDVVLGDQINQDGPGTNIGKILQRV
jgi:hypothetical protein